MARDRRGFSTTSDRVRKARKIEVVLRDFTREDLGSKRILDVGTGSGEIASILGATAEVTSVDNVDCRTVTENYRFVKVRDETLPFADETFDIVVSNHVVEHLDDPKRHVTEIARVLKRHGVVYMATPNRCWPWEVHYRVPLLHFLPSRVFRSCLKMLGMYKEDVELLTLFSLKQLLSTEFDIFFYSDRIAKHPETYFMNYPSWLQTLLAAVPLSLYTFLLALNPTFVAVLRKRPLALGVSGST